MIKLRKSAERGHANHGWLDSHHTFSFANYHDPRFGGFRQLLVINEDRVQPGHGFGTHGHRDMEIITYVLEGELAHQDSITGLGSVIRPGDVQRMTAGRGVRHSEFNHSAENPLHFLQIWILPSKRGLEPSYEEKQFTPEEKRNRLRLIVSPNGEQGSLCIHQDARIYTSLLNEGKSVSLALASGRYAWIQVTRGAVDVNGIRLEAGDGAAISEERELQIEGQAAAELLVFDLP